jgi:SAM-dependent methyltransferase
MTPLFTAYSQIFDHYVDVSRKYIRDATKVLKTDCFNEYYPERIPIVTDSTIQIVEYQPEHIEATLTKNPKLRIVQGDIRNLPLPDNSYDLLLDLSTLDHVPQSDLPGVFSEYGRVLKSPAKLVLITWTVDTITDKEKAWNPDDQYYFEIEVLRNELKKLFTIKEDICLIHDNIQPYGEVKLWEFVCEK